MDLNKTRPGNSSNPSLSSLGRRSSIDSISSNTTRTRDKFARLFPGRSRSKTRKSTIETALPDKVEQNESLVVDPKDLNLVDSGEEDLLTIEDEPRKTSTRPDLSTHNSHAGFLTLSSPQIPAETIPLNQESGQVGSKVDSPTTISSETQRKGSDKSESTGVGRVGILFGGRSRKASGPKQNQSGRVLQDLPLTQEPAEKTPSPKKPVPLLRTIISTPSGDPSPQTFVTPPTPIDQEYPEDKKIRNLGRSSSSSPSRRRSSTSEGDTFSTDSGGHRRAKSSLTSSKLFQSLNPLTPAEEEIKTPGGTLSAPSGGFFSSIISAAQNATSTVSNTINFGSRNKSSPTLPDTDEQGGEEVILSKSASSEADSKSDRSRKPAVETLGLGNLSLSHLGIADPQNPSRNSSQVDLMETANQSTVAAAEAIAKKEDNAASKAISKAYEKVNGEKASASPEPFRTVVASDDAEVVHDSIELDNSSIRRAGSVRSKLSNGRRRRTRGSSLNTNGNSGSFPTARFTAAAPKRNRDFHNTFKSVPEDDQLIEDYAAALQKEILLQGRLYVSEGHVCFFSNIFGYVTTLIISFDEIISVEKKSTAMIFQNGIVIQTLHARNVFASLLNRDATYELIISIWKVINPNLRSSLNGNPVEGAGTGDKTEKVADQDDDSASEEIYDEDDEDDDDGGESFAEAIDHSTAASEAGEALKSSNRKVSANVATGLSATGPKSPEAAEAAAAAASGTKQDFPGPATHAQTDCGDQPSHYEKVLLDANIPAPLGKVYNMVFGPASPEFMQRFLTESEKAWDFVAEENETGLTLEQKTRKFQYIRPLTAPIGPKQTKCIISETLEMLDYEKAIIVTCNTSNPDVPSGSIFVVKTRYCLMWAAGNSTRMLITYTVAWSGRSLLKGAIESGVNSGQGAYAKALVAFITAAVGKSSRTKSTRKGGRRKRSADSELPTKAVLTQNSDAQSSDWGVFEPFKQIWEILGAFAPPSSLVIGILIATIVALFYRSPKPVHGTPGTSQYYDRVWGGEEAELWNWIEERVESRDALSQYTQKRSVSQHNVGKLAEQEVSEAIRVTKERLNLLEQVVERERDKKAEGTG